jgi:hypothetical protein
MTKSDLIGCFERMNPNPAQKQRMLDRILGGGKEEAKPLNRSAKHVYLTAALIALAVLTMTTALAIGFGWHQKLIEYLEPSEEQMAALDGAADTPDATITKNGVTITVKQTLADSFGIYVLYEMTVPEDIELTDDIWWGFSYLDVPTVKTDEYVTMGTSGPEILEQTGNKRTVLYHAQKTAPFENGHLKLLLMDLQIVKRNDATGSMQITPLIEGEWELEWEFNFVDTSKTLEVNEPGSSNGSENTITKIVISPMSGCAYITGDDIVGSARPAVNFKDGTQIEFDSKSKNASFGYYLVDEDSMLYANHLYYRFETIIDLDDVKNITIGAVTIPIE